jgi:hypothetical protein
VITKEMGSGHSTANGSSSNTTPNPPANAKTIVAINSLTSTQLTTAQFNLIIEAMNQSLPAFCTVWGFPQITVAAGNSYVAGCFGYINLIVGNNQDLGYHTLDDNNVPMAVINYSAHVYDNQMLGYQWDFTGIDPTNATSQHSFLSTTFGHEIFEMIGDPTLRALGPNGEKIAFKGSDGVSDPICREVCDPVCDVEIVVPLSGSTTQIYMSNYVYPNWFEPNSSSPYDALGVLTAPLTLYDSNCYVTETNGQTESSRLLSKEESKEEVKEEIKEDPTTSPRTSPTAASALLLPVTASQPKPFNNDRYLLGASMNPQNSTGSHFASRLSAGAKEARARERSSIKPRTIITARLPRSTSSSIAQYNQNSIRPVGYSAPISPIKEDEPVSIPGVSPQPTNQSIISTVSESKSAEWFDDESKSAHVIDDENSLQSPIPGVDSAGISSSPISQPGSVVLLDPSSQVRSESVPVLNAQLSLSLTSEPTSSPTSSPDSASSWVDLGKDLSPPQQN